MTLQFKNVHSTKFDSLKSVFEKSQSLKITFVKYVFINFDSIHLQFSNIQFVISIFSVIIVSPQSLNLYPLISFSLLISWTIIFFISFVYTIISLSIFVIYV